MLSIGTFILVSLIKIVLALFVLLTAVAYTVWLERKVVGHMQNRWGPTRVGPFGLLQPLADGVKFLFKEDLTPPHVYKPLYIAAPMIAVVFALTSIAVIPVGNSITIGGMQIPLQITDVNIGLLIVLGITSLGVYGVALAGWSSNSKYSLLGGLRASAQMVSYEIALGLSLVGVLILSGSFSLREIVDAQAGTFWGFIPRWNIFPGPVHRIFYLPDGGVCGNQSHPVRFAGSGNRIGGRLPHRIQRHEICHVLHGRIRQHDYGGLPGLAAVSGRMARAVVRAAAVAGAAAGVLVCAAIFAFLFLYIWVRGTLPRFRYDQLMAFGWKFLLPLAIANLVVTALIVALIEVVAQLNEDASSDPIFWCSGRSAWRARSTCWCSGIPSTARCRWWW